MANHHSHRRFGWVVVAAFALAGLPAATAAAESTLEGYDGTEACPIDIDIHAPAAQDAGMARLAEGTDATRGAYTLRNNDIDATPDALPSTRLKNRDDLRTVEATTDDKVRVGTAVPADDDLVAIDLFNPDGVQPVFMNIYEMVSQRGDTDVDIHRPKIGRGLLSSNHVRVWTAADRSGTPVKLPYQMVSRGGVETLYIEGLKAGRFRVVLFHAPDVTPQQARAVRAIEAGNPNATPAAESLTLVPAIACQRNVRLTVAAVDIFQTAGSRPHVFDVLWGGRPVFDGRLWPAAGTWEWKHEGVTATWLDGDVWGQSVAATGTNGAAEAAFADVRGAFAHEVTEENLPVAGSAVEYGDRVVLEYTVEGVTLRREEPLTVMVPHRVTLPDNGRSANFTGFNQPIKGAQLGIAFHVTYYLFDQHDRWLRGRPQVLDYARQYGARIKMYEALGTDGSTSTEVNDVVSMIHDPSPPGFPALVNTAQRLNAVPAGIDTMWRGFFRDEFTLAFTQEQRDVFEADIQKPDIDYQATIFSIRQDVVTLIENEVASYDVRVARGQQIEFLGPSAPAPGKTKLGPFGFRLRLGSADRTELDTGAPFRVSSDHNP